MIGPPNSGKSSSFKTFPGPSAVLSYPNEMGSTSLPSKSFDGHPVLKRVWEGDLNADTPATAWAQAVKDLKAVTKEMLDTKPRSFMGDGIHKLYPVFMNDVTFGAYGKGLDFDAKLWQKGTGAFIDYLNTIKNSAVENVVFTIWAAPEADKNTGAVNADKKDFHVFPDLPGKQSNRILGEFSLSLYCFREGGQFKWLTQPEGDIGGVGAKLPGEVLAKLPKKVPQDWAGLMKLLEAA